MHLFFNLLFRSVSIFYPLIGPGIVKKKKKKSSSVCMAQKPQRVSRAESWLSPCGSADGPASQQLCKWKAECCWRSERAGKLATKRKNELQVAKWKCNGKINGTRRFAEWINWRFFVGSVFFFFRAKKEKKPDNVLWELNVTLWRKNCFNCGGGECLLWLLCLRSPLP